MHNGETYKRSNLYQNYQESSFIIEDLSHLVSHSHCQFSPASEKGERLQIMPSTHYLKSLQHIHEKTAIKPSKCALIIERHLPVITVKFLNTHAESKMIMRKTLQNCNMQMRFLEITYPKLRL